MPKPADTSDELSALDALARSPQYRQVIRYLVEHPNSYKGDIQEGTGANPSSLQRHLGELEQRGIVVGDVAREDRRGYAVRYTVDVDYVERIMARLRTELLG